MTTPDSQRRGIRDGLVSARGPAPTSVAGHASGGCIVGEDSPESLHQDRTQAVLPGGSTLPPKEFPAPKSLERSELEGAHCLSSLRLDLRVQCAPAEAMTDPLDPFLVRPVTTADRSV